MPIFRKDYRTLEIAVRILAAATLLFILAIFWLAMNGTPSAKWPILGWPNPNRYVAELNQTDGKSSAAAANLIHAQPVSANSLAALAYHQQKIGKPEAAIPVLSLAGQMGWRNPTVQSFWARVALLAGDWTVAAQRIDALMRINAPKEQWRPQLQALLSNPDGLNAMAIQAKNGPPWLSNGFVDVTRSDITPTELNNRLALLAATYQIGAQPDCYALARITNTAIDSGIANRGWTMWTRFCDKAALLPGKGLNLTTAQNALRTSSQFSWYPLKMALFSVNNTVTPEGGLVVHISGSSSFRETVSRRKIVLQPGSYRISWVAKDSNGKPADNVIFSVRCSTGGELVQDQDSGEDSTDKPIAQVSSFIIPTQACPVQTVDMQVEPNRSTTAGSEITVSNVRISPIG